MYNLTMDYSKKIKIGAGKIRVGGGKINHFNDWGEYSDTITQRHLDKSKHRVSRRLLDTYYGNDPTWSMYSADLTPYSASGNEEGYSVGTDGETISFSMSNTPQRYIEGSFKITYADSGGTTFTTRAIPYFSTGEHIANVFNEDLFAGNNIVALASAGIENIPYKGTFIFLNYPAGLALPTITDKTEDDKFDTWYLATHSQQGTTPTVLMHIATADHCPSWCFHAGNPTGANDPSNRNIDLSIQLSNLVIGGRYFYEIYKTAVNTLNGSGAGPETQILSGNFDATQSSNTINHVEATQEGTISYFRYLVYKKTLGVTFDLTGPPDDPDQDTTIDQATVTPFPKGRVNNLLPLFNRVDYSFDGNYDNVYAMWGAPTEFSVEKLPVTPKSITIKNCASLTSFNGYDPNAISQEIETIDLSSNSLTSFSFPFFFSLPIVTSINLSGNGLTSFGTMVESTFPSCPKIQSIDLSNNNISEDGLKSLSGALMASADNGTIDFSGNSTAINSYPFYSTFSSMLSDKGWTITIS